MKHVDKILIALAEDGVTLKMKKCNFFSASVEYLGHNIRLGRLESNNANTNRFAMLSPQLRRQRSDHSSGFVPSIGVS